MRLCKDMCLAYSAPCTPGECLLGWQFCPTAEMISLQWIMIILGIMRILIALITRNDLQFWFFYHVQK